MCSLALEVEQSNCLASVQAIGGVVAEVLIQLVGTVPGLSTELFVLWH
jgi:hypothetical protein